MELKDEFILKQKIKYPYVIFHNLHFGDMYFGARNIEIHE